MRFLYSVLTYLLRPVAFAIVLWRGFGNRRYWEGLAERFALGPRASVVPTVWLHAVSLGEVTAAVPLVRALRARHPELPLWLTTATPTGRARARSTFGDTITVRYLPYDTPGSMRRFLARAQPCLAIVMETELWPNLFHQCRRRGIPVVLANARLSPKSVTRYQRFGALFRDVVSGGTWVAAQTDADAARFIEIGAEPARTRVIGNLKFDVAVEAAVIERGRLLRAASWGARPAWIAGSTHEGEEEAVLTAQAALQAAVPGVLLLLVPRHPERFQAVADLLNRRGFRFERRSSDNPVRADTQVLLVDTVGELAALYAAVDVAFVGGSLVPVGGHNLLEPCALGVPALTGPYQANAKEIAALLLREGAVLQVADATELGAVLQGLLGDAGLRRRIGANGLRVVAANQGALERLLELIEPSLARGTTR